MTKKHRTLPYIIVSLKNRDTIYANAIKCLTESIRCTTSQGYEIIPIDEIKSISLMNV